MEPHPTMRGRHLARNAFRTLLFILVAAYLAAAAYMAINQRNFIYRPAPEWISPESQNLPRGEALTFTTPDGTTLRGWQIPATRADGQTYLYFHGNARGLDRRAGRFQLMTADGSGLVAMSYRGFGGSSGEPTEALLHADAEAIYADLARRIPPARIVLFGESLGTGVALNLARKVEARAVILDSPYLSVMRRAGAQFPWLPISLLLVDTFRSDQWIGEVKAPILILHGTKDRLIPLSDSEALAALAEPGQVTRIIYPGEPHVVPYNRGPDRDVPAFLGRIAPKG
jgi:uncharacterized protein